MLFLLALAATALATFFDVRERRIPNAIPAGLLLVTAALTAAGFHPLGWSQAAFGALTAALITLPLYALSWFGAGDSKHMIALGAALGLGPFLVFFVATTFVGGVLALLARRSPSGEIPYAPAMLLGLIALSLLPLLPLT